MKKTLALLTLALLLTGCAYTNIRSPMDENFDNTDLGSKEGRSSNRMFCYLVYVGDAGTRAAAEDGGIKTIKHADVEIFSILFGLYTRISTVVYGD